MKSRYPVVFALVAVLVSASSLFAVEKAANAAPTPTAATSPFDIPPTDDGLPGRGPIRRADWFRPIWIERRTTFAHRVAQDQGALVFLGDSITQGWGDNLGDSFPGVKVANRGIGGDTTRGVLVRLKEDVLAVHPSGVVLLVGTNDIEEHADTGTIAGNIRLILDELEKSNPKIPIVVCEVFPSSDEKHRSASAIKEVNAAIAKAVAKDSHVTILPTYALFADSHGDAPKELFPDLLHPNQAGYAKWATALRPVLAKLGFGKGPS